MMKLKVSYAVDIPYLVGSHLLKYPLHRCENQDHTFRDHFYSMYRQDVG